MKLKFVIIFLVVTWAYFLLPSLFYKINRIRTEEADIFINMDKYNSLAYKASRISIKEQPESLVDSLDSLRLWLRIRGVAIDRGHISLTTNEKWNEILEYYTPR